MSNSPDISIVIPLRNESDTFPYLWSAICEVMAKMNWSWELVVVDDASCDETRKLLQQYASDHPHMILERFSERRGQAEALRRGFSLSRGDIVVSMDADLQDDPAYLHQFIEKIHEGWDAVCGYRQHRKDSTVKIVLSLIGNTLQRLILRTGVHDISCTFRAYKKEILPLINLRREGFHRYIPFFLSKEGCSLSEIKIIQKKRMFGQSHYSSMKVFSVVGDFLTLIVNRHPKASTSKNTKG